MNSYLILIAAATWGADGADFNRDVKPILAEHCLQCHGPDKAEAGLDLSRREAAVSRLESGRRAIAPNNVEDSELLRRITSTDPDERMPPGADQKPLSGDQMETLRQWIAAGAEYRDHWAFTPVVKPSPPAVRDSAWVRSPLDRFILARLEAEGIRPSPEADRATLAKRLSLDLIGLLPEPERVEAFVRDDSPQAYEAYVDELLRSPHFGERWGRHWLDLARYADSDGYEKDKARPDAYVFRDWVIKALNDDLPFDQFTIEQIAGDLLPNAAPSQHIATAFQRQTLTNEEGGVDQEEYRVAAVFDRVETVGAVWLGLTVGCARCHTHKYDPILHEEYYRLFAFFNAADETTVSLPVAATDLEAYLRDARPIEQALEQRRREIAPQQLQWETEQREKLLQTPKTPLSAAPATLHRVELRPEGQNRYLAEQHDGGVATVRIGDAATPPTAEPLETVIEAAAPTEPLTGLRLEALTHESLPGQGPGLSAKGNFVLSRVQLAVVDSQGRVEQEVPLQMASADFEQKGFPARDALNDAATPLRGWAVMGKTGATHQWTVRTREPLVAPPDRRLRVTLTQAYGRDHIIGRLRLYTLHGDARTLQFPEAIASALEMYPEKRIAAVKQTLFNYFAEQDPQIREGEQRLAALKRTYQVEFRPVRTLGESLRGRQTHRFHRGEFLQPQEEVTAGAFRVLPPFAAAAETRRLTRLDLARWLVDDAHPLTPRVTANQVWLHLFGEGLVRTPGDFGARGEPPTHPELLDWLAATFREDLHWSVKSLIKLIVSSAAYRQSSVWRSEDELRDPQNRLLRRQNRWRVEGEVVRDVTLQAAGLLSRKVGGPSVFPAMPADLAKLSYANNFSWQESGGEDRYRRGMYTFFKRTIPHPTLMTFDCPDANVACVRRTTSNTPLQALTLLNNSSFVEAAAALAGRIERTPGEDADRLNQALQTCLLRPPRDGETARLNALLQEARDYYAARPEEARRFLHRKADEGENKLVVETAAWGTVMRVLLNLDEFVTRP
ncbi:MAG: PSD1 and planctomycete cytochrome C domain-containing protein [Pirellulales bacterium]